VLVWHGQTPDWVFRDINGNPMTPTPENKALLLQRMENHIRAVAGHFGSDVYAWDVVNEVIDPSQPDGFRRSPWFNITGTDFIDRAFQVAHEVAPNAKLFISDYSTTDQPKRTFLLNLVRDLKARGIPVDAVAHQMHNNVEYPSAEAILETVNQFAEIGVDQEATELDMSIYSGNYSTIYTAYEDIPADRFIIQAYKYRDFFQAFRYLAGKISAVTFWGQADDHTWLTSPSRVNAPLLFDISLIHKPAYTALIDPADLPAAASTATFSGAFVVRPPSGKAARKTATSTFSLLNDRPSGTFTFNYNDPSTKVRFKSTDVITYSVSTTDSGPRLDFTIVGTNLSVPGFIVTGYAIDGGPEGSGLDVMGITVRTATGSIVYAAEGPVSDGDVVIK
jgi:endo-1,4-beta-xylanase